MFHPERDLKQIIISMLSEDGRSISYLSRELKKQGFDMHRLTLTGYLRALSDMNVLKEKDVPPAKIYIPVKGKEKDIYLRVTEQAKIAAPDKFPELTLYAFFKLFKRPIFKEELERAGVFEFSPGVQAREDEIADARKFMQKSGFKIPTSSKAYVPLNEDLEANYQNLLVQMLINDLECSYLVKETKQAKLDL
ncbi:MAG: hypothetical protein KBA58_04300 [Methanomassiliicoccales archaeon]|nr:hypothetical protein [Methanomassiliicoccales archaeon]